MLEIMSALLTYFMGDGNFCQAFRAIATEKAVFWTIFRNFTEFASL
jgi:hypothetical protein